MPVDISLLDFDHEPYPIPKPRCRPLAKLKQIFSKTLANIVPCIKWQRRDKLSARYSSVIPIPVPKRKELVKEELSEFQWDEEEKVFIGDHGKRQFHDVAIGEKMSKGKYKVVRKLGYGRNATVWLAKARNFKQDVYVAIKVLTTDATEYTMAEQDQSELGFLRELRQSKFKEHPGYGHCAPLIVDAFLRPSATYRSSWISNHHHLHLCLVQEPVGCTIQDLQIDIGGRFELHVAKRITKQLLLALDYLHTVSKIIHTDIKSDNMAVAIEQDPERIKQYIEEVPPEIYPPRYCPGLSSKPITTYASQPLANLGLSASMMNIKVKLLDYGSAVRVAERPAFMASPFMYRAPEIALSCFWSTPADIWSLGINVFGFLCGNTRPFHLFKDPLLPGSNEFITQENRELLGQVEAYIGPIPESLKSKTLRWSWFFDISKGGALISPSPIPPRPLEDIYMDMMYRVQGIDEMEPTLTFLRRCLTIDPDERPTAAELLKDKWLGGV